MKLTVKPLLAATAFGTFATAAVAEYPERPINMVIPYGAGGATDISARTIAEPLCEAVGKPLIMVNVQNATPDGHTMLFARVGSHSVNPAMKATLPYTLDDFRFVTVYEINPVACAVNPSSGIESMEDLVNEGGVTYSSSGLVRCCIWRLSWCSRNTVSKTLLIKRPIFRKKRRRGCNCSAERHRSLPVHQFIRFGQLRGQQPVDPDPRDHTRAGARL